MSLTIAQFAADQGISEQRARELARTGKVPAKRVGRSWIIDAESSERKRPGRRPLSPTSLDDLLTVLADMNLDSVTGVRKQRAAERLRLLRAVDHPAALLSEWAGSAPVKLERAHQRAILLAAMRGLDDYIQLILNEVEADDLSEPSLLRKRLQDAMQVRRLSDEDLSQAAAVPLKDVKLLRRSGRLRNFGRTTRILHAAGLKPGVVPR